MYVIGKDEALRFASENCTNYKERYLEDIDGGFHRSYLFEAAASLKEALVLEGVSELVELYQFRKYSEHTVEGEKTFWTFEGVVPGIRLLKTGQLATPWKPRGKSRYGLSLLRDAQTEGRLAGFSFDGVHPDLIGRPSESKLTAWFEYINAEDDAKKVFIETANKRNRAFLDKVQSKYPKAKAWVNKSDGWVTRIELVVGYVLMIFEAGDDGRFYRTTRVDILSLPSTEELLK